MLYKKQKSFPAKTQNALGFTLVELIVVVTILAILATIGFVSYSSYLTGVRDTNRLSQLVSISDGLELYRTKKDLPLPDDNIEIQMNGTIIAYQGYAGSNTLETIDFTKGGKDPKDDSYFTYYLTEDRKYFQLLGFLEEEENLSSLVSSVQAVDYSNRLPTVYGKKLGVLTNTLNVPVQEVETGFLNITPTTTGYKAHMTDTEVFTDTELMSINPIASCKRIKQLRGGSSDGVYAINPEGDNEFDAYCDMTTDGGGWTLVGISNENRPGATFLDGVTGTAPNNLQPGYEYSIDASDILFSEVAMGIDGDRDKYFGMFTTDIFENERAFEASPTGTETCVIIDGYYTTNNGVKKYWKEHYGFGETLLSNRRASQGGIDHAGVSGCDSSSNSLAVYRVTNTHSVAAGNSANVSATWSSMASTTKTPSTSGLSQSDYPEPGVIDRDVWVMVR